MLGPHLLSSFHLGTHGRAFSGRRSHQEGTRLAYELRDKMRNFSEEEVEEP